MRGVRVQQHGRPQAAPTAARQEASVNGPRFATLAAPRGGRASFGAARQEAL